MMKARETAQKVRAGVITATQAAQDCLAQIEKLNPQLNAFLEIFGEEALARAAQIDAKPAAQRGALAGICVALKDNMEFAGHTMSCASRMLAGYKAVYNATVVERLLAADAIIIGRANMDEFAMGSSNENSAFGPVKNPLDLTRVSGGSSGGSAAAVAAGMVSLALGSDTGGSIRQPAAFCGVVGIKPTYGRVSRRGLAAFASSLDQIGPITADVEDNILALSVISGEDKNDSTCAARAPFAAENCEVKNLTVGVPQDFIKDLNPAIASALGKAKGVLQNKGVKFKDISLPHAKYALPAYYIVACSEASSNLARFDGLRYGHKAQDAKDLEDTYLKNRAAFGPEVKRRIMLGTYSLGSAHAQDYYLKAKKVCDVIRRDFELAFSGVDAILTPATPTTAFKLNDKNKDLLSLYLSDLYTVPANIAGVPAVSAPFGRDGDNLPIGLQVYGNYCEENKIYALAAALEGQW
ncbi:MAG: Asp-tRNA(Asn)/Glu-tRNA(Gln) amidotransferase subunit GatA [Elusimicrobiota bacterium]|jgi:aspartyl-tRNA(Asn)/glutamyl-tRNA(Gln) amidotransferase subunit A|nr:Asp-tRNA(Asn)/Glu-tRNA(Gln) amidotransferase subunit GatA [Elusimicrobiota bacterium]